MANPTVNPSFSDALLRGEPGYAVCIMPQRFARLPEAIAVSFAEIGEPNSYYVFATEEGARERLQRIPECDRFGYVFTIRKIHFLPISTPRDGPRLDATGHPFQMRGFIVDQSGNEKRWTHSGKLGWRDLPAGTEARPQNVDEDSQAPRPDGESVATRIRLFLKRKTRVAPAKSPEPIAIIVPSPAAFFGGPAQIIRNSPSPTAQASGSTLPDSHVAPPSSLPLT